MSLWSRYFFRLIRPNLPPAILQANNNSFRHFSPVRQLLQFPPSSADATLRSSPPPLYIHPIQVAPPLLRARLTLWRKRSIASSLLPRRSNSFHLLFPQNYHLNHLNFTHSTNIVQLFIKSNICLTLKIWYNFTIINQC